LPASVSTTQGMTELGRRGTSSLVRYPAAPPAAQALSEAGPPAPAGGGR